MATQEIAQPTQVAGGPPVFHHIRIERLRESGLNHRRNMNPDKMAEMVASVRANGIIEPLILRPHPEEEAYQVVCGNRRWQAAASAGLEMVPALIRDLTDEQAMEIILIENCQREDEHPLDIAEAYGQLAEKYADFRVVAAKIGKDPKEVRRWLQFNYLIPAAKKQFREDPGLEAHMLEISRLTDEQQKQTLEADQRHWNGKGFNLRELKDFIENRFHLRLAKAPFDTDDADLVKAAGSCVACPKRTGSDSMLFPDVKEEDTCTDAACYKNKVAAMVTAAQESWKATHEGEVLSQLCANRGGQTKPGILSYDEFEIVKGKDAKQPGVRHGIIVAGENLGKIVSYIPPRTSMQKAAAKPAAERELTLAQKHRELETKQTNEEDMLAIPYLIAQIRRSGKSPLKLDELRILAEEVVNRCHHDMLKRYCDAIFGRGNVPETSYHTKDYSGAVDKRAQEMVHDTVSLALFLLELMLFNHVGQSREKDGKFGSNNPIYTIARDRGVKFDEVWKPLKESYDTKKQKAAARLGLGPAPSVAVPPASSDVTDTTHAADKPKDKPKGAAAPKVKSGKAKAGAKKVAKKGGKR